MVRRDQYYYEQKAAEAKARAAARLAKRKENPKPYNPRNADDLITVFYKDPIIAGRVLLLKGVNKKGVELFGKSDLGLLDNNPDSEPAVEVNRGSGITIVQLYIQYGDATPSVVVTDWGTRWVKFYDNFGGTTQASFLLPFTVSTGTGLNLGTLIEKFDTFFVGNDAPKKNLLGANGRAELRFGKQVLRRFEA